MVIFPLVTTFCKSIKSKNAFVNKIIESGNLFRGEWYITKKPFVIRTDTGTSNITVPTNAEKIATAQLNLVLAATY